MEKTWEIREKEIREQIARDIMAKCDCTTKSSLGCAHDECASTARGQK